MTKKQQKAFDQREKEIKILKKTTHTVKQPKILDLEDKEQHNQNDISEYVTEYGKPFHSKDKNFVIINHTIKFYPLTLATVPHIAEFVMKMINKATPIFSAKWPQGYNQFIKIDLSSSDETLWSSAVFKKKNATLKEMEVKLSHTANKQYATADYIMYVRRINMLSSHLPAAGGCLDHERKSLTETISETKKEIIKITSYRAKINNCLIQCFNVAYGVKGNVMKSDKVRSDLGIEKNTLMHIDMIPKISAYYNKHCSKQLGYSLLNQNQEFILVGGNAKEFVQIYLRNAHYYLYEVINYRKCPSCGRKLKGSNATHKCNIEGISYLNRIVKEKNSIVKVQIIREKEKMNYNNMVHWDLETSQPEKNGAHIPYASGFVENGKYTTPFYGPTCIDQTVDHFITFEKQTISAFYGSGFDFYFLLDKLTEKGVDVSNLIINNGKLMSFEFGKKNKIFDLSLFISSSLKKACKDFKIENAKTEFNHELIKTWADTEKYKSVVLPYLKLDCLALEELFIKFNDMMYEKFQINITKFLTASSMGYEIWSMYLKDVIEIPKEMDKYNFINMAKFGGRTSCHQQEFVSKKWHEELLPKLEKGEIDAKTAYKELYDSGDFIFNADVSSLYPASMRGFDLMTVHYPTGQSRWSKEPKVEFAAGRLGFYTIKYSCPKNIRIPILPQKKLLHGVSIGVKWDLLDSEGTYTSVDIQNAISNGYKVEFIGKCLVYDTKSDNVFTEYIDKFYNLKQEAEREGNPVLRAVSKLFLNALYGKTLQKAIFTTNIIVNKLEEFNDFAMKYEITGWKFLKSGKLLVTGDAILREKQIRNLVKLEHL